MKFYKTYIISFTLILCFSLFILFNFYGCGALVALVSSIFGSQGGFIFIPFLGDEKLSADETGKQPGMIMLFTNNPPANYKPLSGASVSIEGNSETVTTKADGSFYLAGIPVGIDTLKVEHPLWVSIQQKVAIVDPNVTVASFTNFRIIPDKLLSPVGTGGIFQFTAFGDSSSGPPVIPATTWSVTGDIGTISSTGIFTATKAGTGNIRAVSGSNSAEISVTVVAGTGTVYGKVLYNDRGIGNSEVRVEDTNIYTITDPNGNYSITGVPSTTVLLIATDQTGRTGSTGVSVTSSSQVEGNIVLLSEIPTPTHSGGATATPTHSGGATATPTHSGGATATPTQSGGATATPTATPAGGGPQMVSISGGTFNMGSNVEYWEEPVHSVTVSSFNMGKYELTNSDYVLFLNSQGNQTEGGYTWIDLTANPSQGITGGPNPGTFTVISGYETRPVVYVSWYGSVAYCNWLSSQQGLTPCYGPINNRGTDPSLWRTLNGYRLPTEAEWEYACRAGSATDYYWGNTMNDSYCWYGNNSGGSLHNTGQLLPNNFGLYDMSGNVYEWCSDWYSASDDNPPAYYGISPGTDPTGPSTGTERVARGGSYSTGSHTCRSSARYGPLPWYRYSNQGFRVVRNQ